MKKQSSFLSRFSFIASLDLTVILLLLLSVLVVWGTLYQVNNGIYAAQERFFKAWYTTIGGIVPFPAVKGIVLLLAINLLAQVIHPRRLSVKTAGLYIIHIGVMVLVVSSSVSSQLIKEAAITLQKGQCAQDAYDFSSWQLEIMEKNDHGTRQLSIPVQQLRNGKKIGLTAAEATLVIDQFHENCSAKINREDNVTVQELIARPSEKERGRNVPGASIHIVRKGNGSAVEESSANIFAAVERPVFFSVNNTAVTVSLTPRRMTLPFRITLRSFDVKWHPGTTKAKSYRSTVRVLGKNIDREVAIEMNRPFRYGAFTFYQMSYSGGEGHYATSLAVVYNPLRYMPYVASIIVVAGLLLHFLVKLTSALSPFGGTRRE